MSVGVPGPYTNHYQGERPSRRSLLIVGSPRARVRGYQISDLELDYNPFLAALPRYLKGRARSQHHYIPYSKDRLLNLSAHCDVG